MITVTIKGEVIQVENKDIEIEHIIAYCQEHNKVAWLKETAAKEVEYKKYPRIKVQQVKNGEPVFTKKGKPKMVMIADKTQAPIITKDKISYVQIKLAFLEKFGFAKEKTEKVSMYDLINSL